MIHLASNQGEMGGGEVMLLALAESFRELGHGVHILAPRHPGAVLQAAWRAGFPATALGSRSGGRADYARALLAWRLTHPSAKLWCNGLLPAVATSGTARRVVHLHQLPQPRHHRLMQAARMRSALTLVPSEYMADNLQGAVVLENWTSDYGDGRADRPRPAGDGPAAPSGPIRIGMLGRLTRRKGTFDLLEAMSILGSADRTGPGSRLVLGGEALFGDEGDAEQLTEALQRSTGVDHLGWVQPADLLAQIDVFVVPSLAPEPFGLVAAEAMSAGVPVIVTDSGALPEVVGPEHPWIVPPGDPQALAAMIEQVAGALHEPTAAHVVTAARARWEDRYSPAAGTRRLAALLEGPARFLLEG